MRRGTFTMIMTGTRHNHPWGVLVVLVISTCLLVGCGTTGTSERRAQPATLDQRVEQCSDLGVTTEDPKRVTACLSEIALPLAINAHGNPAAIEKFSAAVNRYGDPALTSICHGAMHDVGIAVAHRERLGPADLMDVFPAKADRQCIPGYIHGLMMGINEQLVSLTPKQLIATCQKATLAEERFSCIHGLGHTYSRNAYLDTKQALKRCKKLGGHFARDCAMGAFHDRVITLATDTPDAARDDNASPREVCADVDALFVETCWFRAFMNASGQALIDSPEAFRVACLGLAPKARSACYAGAVHAGPTDPFEQLAACSELPQADMRGCVNGIDPHAITPDGTVNERHAELLGACETLPHPVGLACSRRIARLITAMTWGRFTARDCPGTGRFTASCRRGVKDAFTPLSDGFPSDLVHVFGGYGGYRESGPKY